MKYPKRKLRRGARPKVTLSDKLLQFREFIQTAENGRQILEAEQRFIRQCKGLVKKCSRWYVDADDHGMSLEECWAQAYLGLWEAVRTWDPRKAPFDTHARWKIRTVLGRMLRQSRIVRGRKWDQFDSVEQMLDRDPTANSLNGPRERRGWGDLRLAYWPLYADPGY